MNILLHLFGAILIVSSVVATPLDDYVNRFDPMTGYSVLKTFDYTGYKAYVLNFTSQKWYDERVLDRYVWWHYLTIVVPDNLFRPNMGFVLISGGSNHGG